MVKFLFLGLVCGAAAEIKVMVFGDSFGELGPSYRALQDMFDQHDVAATVKNAAVGGTRACEWAGQQNGMQMVNKAKGLFGYASPDYVWYTLGANDIWADSEFQNCMQSAVGKDVSVVEQCLSDFNSKLFDCHSILFDNFYKAYPNAKIVQHGYEIPCASSLCLRTVVGKFSGGYCGSNITCSNSFLQEWNAKHLDGLQARYPKPAYTAAPLIGAAQKASKVPGADYNKPVVTASVRCDWETACVHPSYNTPAGQAWADGMWEFYWSHVTPSPSPPTPAPDCAFDGDCAGKLPCCSGYQHKALTCGASPRCGCLQDGKCALGGAVDCCSGTSHFSLACEGGIAHRCGTASDSETHVQSTSWTNMTSWDHGDEQELIVV